MDKKILELQKMIEKNPEEISKLTDIELISLKSLYEQQIEEIDKKINEHKEFFKNLIKRLSKK